MRNKLSLFLVLFAIPAMANQIFAFGLLSSSENIAGTPGSFVNRAPTSIFDFRSLAPDSTVAVVFDAARTEGLHELTWNAMAPLSLVNVGAFTQSADWWTGDPLNGGVFAASAPSGSQPYAAAAVPGPSVVALVLAGLVLLRIRLRFRLGRSFMPTTRALLPILILGLMTPFAKPDSVKLPAQLPNLLKAGVSVESSGLVFSSFSFRSPAGIDPSTVTVFPGNTGLLFENIPLLTSSGTAAENYFIFFGAKPIDNDRRISGISIFLGANAYGEGADVRLQGLVLNLANAQAHVTAGQSTFQDKVTFAPQTSVMGAIYLALDGKNSFDSTSAQISQVSFTLTPATVGSSIPEPGSLLLIGGGLILIALRRSWRILASKFTHDGTTAQANL